jgi:hypothetical protein
MTLTLTTLKAGTHITVAGTIVKHDIRKHHIARLIKKRRNSKYHVKKNTPKKYMTKEFLSYFLLF